VSAGKTPHQRREVAMEVMALFMYLLFSELTVQVYGAFGDSVVQQSNPIGWGLGMRVRLPVRDRDALRLRLDGRRFTTKEPSAGPGDPELHTVVAADYLWRGGAWKSSWYGGVGAGWLHREWPAASGDKATSDTMNSSVILGRAQSLGNGQVVVETRLELSGSNGKLAPTAAFSLAYRYHFKNY
jgi:hypothetical protein